MKDGFIVDDVAVFLEDRECRMPQNIADENAPSHRGLYCKMRSRPQIERRWHEGWRRRQLGKKPLFRANTDITCKSRQQGDTGWRETCFGKECLVLFKVDDRHAPVSGRRTGLQKPGNPVGVTARVNDQLSGLRPQAKDIFANIKVVPGHGPEW